MYTLVITSTVYVISGQTFLKDPAIRKRQYIESILYYLNTEMVSNIIVCDNSGYDYSQDEELLKEAAEKGKRLELLYYKGDTAGIRNQGKGYGEGEIISYVLENSKLMNDGVDAFCKVTGRVYLLNIDSILKRIKPGNTYFQKVGLNPFADSRQLDTRFYYCTKYVFSNYLLNAFRAVNDEKGYYLEHAYYDHLKAKHELYRSFKLLPHFKGISGSTGESYEPPRKIRWMIEKSIYAIIKALKS